MTTNEPSTDFAPITSIQHRCTRMALHSGHGGEPGVPVPCSGCYSVRVTTERIPYQATRSSFPRKPPVSPDDEGGAA